MPSKRTPKNRPANVKLTPQAIMAWKNGDSRALHIALGLPPWMECPLDYHGTSDYQRDVVPGDHERMLEIRKALILGHGYPGTESETGESSPTNHNPKTGKH